MIMHSNFVAGGPVVDPAMRLARLAKMLMAARTALATRGLLTKAEREGLNAALDELGTSAGAQSVQINDEPMNHVSHVAMQPAPKE